MMFKRLVAPLVLVVALAGAGPVLADELSPHQVYQLAESGHMDQALAAMNEVLKNHPDKPEAHFVEAELQARVGDYQRAREELATALRLDPSGSFEKRPGALAALQRQIARGDSRGPVGNYRTAPVPVQQHRSGSFWPVALLIFAGIVIAWALLSRRRAQYYPPAGGPVGGGFGGPGPMGGGYGPAGYGPPMGGGGMGSGIVGGLASGLAIGAGVAAGEELVHHLVDRDGNRIPAPPDYVPQQDDNNANMGGNDFGVSDSNSWGSDGGSSDSSFGGDSSGGGGGDDSWT
jgi:hypothetical protein